MKCDYCDKDAIGDMMYEVQTPRPFEQFFFCCLACLLHWVVRRKEA